MFFRALCERQWLCRALFLVSEKYYCVVSSGTFSNNCKMLWECNVNNVNISYVSRGYCGLTLSLVFGGFEDRA